MTIRFDGRVAIVTGASRGLGEAIALGYARAGAAVVLAARTLEAIDSLAARMNSAEGSDVLADLNRLAAERGYRALTTAAVVTYYRAESNLYFAYAGHPPMFLRRTSGDRWQRVTLDESPEAANLPLGVDPEMKYDQQQIPLAKGDRLFMYTDGLVEAPDAGKLLFGTSRLLAALEAGSGKTPKDVKDTVLAALWGHTAGRLNHDDVTFMVVEVR